MSPQPSDVDGGKVAGAELLATALQTIAQPVWVVDRDGRIRFANAAAVAALGYSDVRELIGRDSHQMIHHHRPDGSPYPAAECPMLRPRTTGQTVTSDLDWFFRRDGSRFRVSYVSAPLEMADGRGAVVAFTDIEARSRAEEALRGREAKLVDELSALRRVATLVAGGIGSEAFFGAVADEVKALLGADVSAVVRFEADGTVAVMGDLGGPYEWGARVPLDRGYVVASVRETGSAARFDADDPAAAGMPEVVRALGIRSGLASPIVVDGELWGAITVASLDRGLPADAEQRLTDFTELLATAISNAQAREDLRRLADEQAALRRVATLVAREASQAEVFTSVAEEIGQLLGTDEIRMLRYVAERSALVVASWGANEDAFPVGSRHSTEGDSVASRVLRTGRTARIDDYEKASGPIAEAVRSVGLCSVVGAPILVEGRLWGAMVTGTTHDEPLPPDTESRLSQFTDLMATAISNAESHARADRLAEEQAALGRVATLVAKEASLAEVFAKVAEEVANLLGDVDCGLWRDEGDGTASAVAIWGASVSAGVRVGTRLSLEGESVTAIVLREGRPCRIGDYPAATGSFAERAREIGLRSAVGCPIVVGGRTWGVMAVATYEAEPFPAETETRIAQFSDLVATAIANTEARAEVERLAEEQAALRRVATLVAQGVRPAEIFSAVSEEVGRLFGSEMAAVARFDPDGPANVVVGLAQSFEGVTVGSRFELDDSMASTAVYRTGRSARIDGVDWSAVSAPIGEVARRLGSVSTVSSPIVVEGRLWGAISVAAQEPLPLHTEERLEKFTGLVATAIANAESSETLRKLADEQAALRRVATLVAEGATPNAVFDAVAAEMETLLGADGVTLSRYEPDEEVTVVAHRGADPRKVPPGTRVSHRGENVTSMVRRSKRSARMEHRRGTPGAIAELVRNASVRVSVGAPIVVDGGLWGVAIANWRGSESPPADTEERMAKFAQLLDTAIANADSRAELIASRARLVTASDDARRRFERDLHDGVQQRLVSLALELHTAEAISPSENQELRVQLAHVRQGLTGALDDLRELTRGIHPAILSEGGLVPALRALGRRSTIPVELNLSVDQRLADHVEVAAYFVVSEALANAAKHAQASEVEVNARVDDDMLQLRIDDDGVGGADPARGSGLTGLADRVTALGGTIAIASPPGGGTSLRVELPVVTR
jgi:PAS domain S-box-containing protein